MKFLKPHIAPTLHSAVGGLISASVLAICAGVVWIIKTFRDLSVPLWSVFILLAALLGAFVIYAAKKNRQHFDAIARLNEKQSDEALALNASAATKIAKVQAEKERLQDILMPKFPPPGSPAKPPPALGPIDPYSK